MSEPRSPFQADVLAGKVALITGGSSGIGFEITRQLGLHGASVAITGRRSAVLEEATRSLRDEGIHAICIQGDVRKPEDCQRWADETVRQLGGLNILVNCAAGNFLAAAEMLSPNGFRTVMEIDTMGTFQMSRAAHGPLKKSGDGCIVNISATLHYGATFYQVHVSAAKAGVDSLTRSMALEWGEDGIRSNGVAPGPISGTAGMSKLMPGSSDEAKDAAAAAEIPLGRMGRKWDIAMAVLYLASPAAGFVSGHVMVVDGAAWMWRKPLLPRAQVLKASRGVEKESRSIGHGKSKL